MIEALTQILSPKRRVDILRDVLQAKSEGRPFVMVFCGVNGVGKSTNLAKVNIEKAQVINNIDYLRICDISTHTKFI